MRWAVVALLPVLALSGCLDDAAPDPLPSQEGTVAALVGADGTTATGTEALRWQGRMLSVEAERLETYAFEVRLPDGFWATHDGAIEVSVHWDYPAYYFQADQRSTMLEITVRDEDGSLVGSTASSGSSFGPLGTLESNLLPAGSGGVRTSTVLLLERIPPGLYTAEVRAVSGHTDYTGIVQVEAAPRNADVVDQPPNLVVLPPNQVAIDYPTYLGVVDPDMALVGRPGCSAPELVFDDQPQRCLRFGNSVGNTGGPFLLYIRDQAPAMGLAGESALTQRIVRSDGSYRDTAAGTSSYHVHHFHQHVQGITHFQLFEYDLEGAARGDPVTEVRKNGWNPAHTGLVTPDATGTADDDQACGTHRPDDVDVCLGLSSGWYDLYSLELFEQYLDIGGVPDGVYELVSSVNIDGVIEETDTTDNWAGIVIRITGDEVEVVGAPTGPH